MKCINLDRAALDAAVAIAPGYYLPILITARDMGLGVMFLSQNGGRFKVSNSKRPIVAIIGDDTDCALGPDGFHRKSLDALFRWADCVVLIACAPSPILYAAATTLAAFMGRRPVIIETRLPYEQVWMSFATTINPEIQMLVGTAEGGRA